MSESEGASEKSSSNRVVPSGLTSKANRKPSANNVIPFNASLFSILSIAAALQLSAVAPQLGSYLSVFLSLFTFEWLNLHFSSMTRTRRACFDVANVLETYQPRARTHGHLFVPDPPTPCVKIADEGNSHDMPKEKNAFSNARDSHYENMYQKAIQMAKEMDQMQHVTMSPNPAENVELKPADPEQDKKDADEKAKKAKEKYDADMSKPFSC